MTESQQQALRAVAVGGATGVSVENIDGRTLRSLQNKGFVKIKVTKTNGSWAIATAQGKKAIN